MPTYQYVCRSCATPLEVVQTFTEPALTDCPNCEGGQLRKVFNSVGVVFKGSGFYRTDSRSDSGSTGLKPSSSSDSGKSESTTDGKPAKANKDADSGGSAAAATSTSTSTPASTAASSGSKTQSASK